MWCDRSRRKSRRREPAPLPRPMRIPLPAARRRRLCGALSGQRSRRRRAPGGTANRRRVASRFPAARILVARPLSASSVVTSRPRHDSWPATPTAASSGTSTRGCRSSSRPRFEPHVARRGSPRTNMPSESRIRRRLQRGHAGSEASSGRSPPTTTQPRIGRSRRTTRPSAVASETPACHCSRSSLLSATRPSSSRSDDADLLVQLRGGDVLWQKERLLNLGLKTLPDGCDKVAWIDGDVLFARPDWAAETARLLEEVRRCAAVLTLCPSAERSRLVRAGDSSGRIRRGRAVPRHGVGHVGEGSAQSRALCRTRPYGLCLGGATRSPHESRALRREPARQRRHGHRARHVRQLRVLGAAKARAARAVALAPVGDAVRRRGRRERGPRRRCRHAICGTEAHSTGFTTVRSMCSAPSTPTRDLRVDPQTGLHRWADASDELRAWSEGYFRERREDGA